MSKQIIFDEEARRKIQSGVSQLADAVKATMGPKGRNVVIDGPHGPVITKDGVTVAKSVNLEDPFENMGVEMVKEVASRTADIAGDGTTTATVLAEAIYSEGLRSVTAGANPIIVKRGIDKAVKKVVEYIGDISVSVRTNEQIKQIATISANGDTEIGTIIANAMDEVGNDGTISVQPSKTTDTTLETVDGMQFTQGFMSPYFASEGNVTELEDAVILIYNKKIASIQDIINILNEVSKSSNPLLLIAKDIEPEVLSTIVINKLKGSLNICVVKAPGMGERRDQIMEDIAILTNGTSITEEMGIEGDDITLDHLGTAKRISVTRTSTTIVDGDGDSDDIDDRIESIKAQIENSDSENEIRGLRDRMGKLSGGVAVISIGASTELELLEKKDRVDDALQATRAAVSEGVVPGGGTALLRASVKLSEEISLGDNEEENLGVSIIRNSLTAPMRQIASNAGLPAEVILSKVREYDDVNIGYNAYSDTYEDLVENGVIDPAKVTRSALEHASSIAGLMLTTECMITDLPSDSPPVPQIPNGYMPGMM